MHIKISELIGPDVLSKQMSIAIWVLQSIILIIGTLALSMTFRPPRLLACGCCLRIAAASARRGETFQGVGVAPVTTKSMSLPERQSFVLEDPNRCTLACGQIPRIVCVTLLSAS